MASPRTSKKGRTDGKTVRFSKAAAPAPAKKRRQTVVDRRASRGMATVDAPPATRRLKQSKALPGWVDLVSGKKNSRRTVRPHGNAFLETISTTRIALLIVAVAAVFTLYVGHVHATQELLADVQQQRRNNLQLHLKYNRLKGAFDRATGPSVIYERARALGLEEGIAYGPSIQLEE